MSRKKTKKNNKLSRKPRKTKKNKTQNGGKWKFFESKFKKLPSVFSKSTSNPSQTRVIQAGLSRPMYLPPPPAPWKLPSLSNIAHQNPPLLPPKTSISTVAGQMDLHNHLLEHQRHMGKIIGSPEKIPFGTLVVPQTQHLSPNNIMELSKSYGTNFQQKLVLGKHVPFKNPSTHQILLST